jgi:hypothetical protein
MRKDYDDDWRFEPPPKSYLCGEFSSKKTHKLLERKEREKREKEERAEVLCKRSAKKKK